MNISNTPAKDVVNFMKKSPIAVVAIGSIEYHGAQAPLGTDYNNTRLHSVKTIL